MPSGIYKRIKKWKHSEETKKRMSETQKRIGNKPPINKKKNEEIWNWKGDNVSYCALHAWIIRKKGKAKICLKCGKDEKVCWANVDHKYSRELSDYIQLCYGCHKRYDIKNNRNKKDKVYRGNIKLI